MSCFLSRFFRHSDRSEAGDTEQADNQSHISDHSHQLQEEPPQQSDTPPPAVPGNHNEEHKTEPDQDRPELSSSVIIDMSNVQSSMELSTIAGRILELCFLC